MANNQKVIEDTAIRLQLHCQDIYKELGITFRASVNKILDLCTSHARTGYASIEPSEMNSTINNCIVGENLEIQAPSGQLPQKLHIEKKYLRKD